MFLRNSVEWKSPVSIAWEIVVIDGEGGAEILYVHGESGAVRREAIVIADQVQICDADEPSFQKSCDRRTPVWDEDGTCLQPAKCNLSEFKVSNDVARENIDMWKDLIETFCCLSVGIGGRLDVMVNSDIETVFDVPSTAPAVGVYATGQFLVFNTLIPSISLNSGAIRLKRPKNLTQIGFPSLRSVKSDRLLSSTLHG